MFARLRLCPQAIELKTIILALKFGVVQALFLAAGKFDGISRFVPPLPRGPDTAMPVTDTRIRNARPSEQQTYKLSDGGCMYLLVTPHGARYWRLDYRFAGKRRTLALGVYPTVTLASARARREDTKDLLANGVYPSMAKKATKRAARVAS
jgi:hypothetical protein